MANFAAKTGIAAIAGILMLAAGCSHKPALSPHAAAELAAKLANDQCDSLYQQRPFRASQHSPILRKGMYEWGGFDPAGKDGFSALVSFRVDGSASNVEVYFSCDPPYEVGADAQRERFDFRDRDRQNFQKHQ